MLTDQRDPGARWVVLDKGLLPWAIVRGDTVYITSAILEELRDKVGDMSLKSLAELLGWDYRNVKVGGRVVRAAVTTLNSLLEFLGREAEETQEQGEEAPGETSA